MKIIATLLIAITLAFGGLVAPAAADEPIPPECEETVQEWRDRALVAEGMARDLAGAVSTLSGENGRLAQTVRDLRDSLSYSKSAEQAAYQREAKETARSERLYVKKVRLQRKVTQLRAKLREFRQR